MRNIKRKIRDFIKYPTKKQRIFKFSSIAVMAIAIVITVGLLQRGSLGDYHSDATVDGITSKTGDWNFEYYAQDVVDGKINYSTNTFVVSGSAIFLGTTLDETKYDVSGKSKFTFLKTYNLLPGYANPYLMSIKNIGTEKALLTFDFDSVQESAPSWATADYKTKFTIQLFRKVGASYVAITPRDTIANAKAAGATWITNVSDRVIDPGQQADLEALVGFPDDPATPTKGNQGGDNAYINRQISFKFYTAFDRYEP